MERGNSRVHSRHRSCNGRAHELTTSRVVAVAGHRKREIYGRRMIASALRESVVLIAGRSLRRSVRHPTRSGSAVRSKQPRKSLAVRFTSVLSVSLIFSTRKNKLRVARRRTVARTRRGFIVRIKRRGAWKASIYNTADRGYRTRDPIIRNETANSPANVARSTVLSCFAALSITVSLSLSCKHTRFIDVA